MSKLSNALQGTEKPAMMSKNTLGKIAAVVAGGGLLTATLALLALPVNAATPACVGTACTVTFAYTGSEQSFTVPAGVTSVTATVAGASGGRGASSGGAPGGTGEN